MDEGERPRDGAAPEARAPADPRPSPPAAGFPRLVLRGVSLGRPEQGRGGGRRRGQFSLMDLQFSADLEGEEREREGGREGKMPSSPGNGRRLLLLLALPWALGPPPRCLRAGWGLC